MPTAYTPGLRITEDMVVRRERRLPIKGDVLVAVGDTTTPDTVVARALLPGNLQTFKAAEQLGESPSELMGLLKKKVGDTIEKNELLAETKGLFGLFRSECRAPVSGTIEHISTTSGFIGIREAPRPIDVRAYLAGKVVEVLAGEGAVIESHGAFLQGIFGVGGERSGALRIAARNANEPLSESAISDDMRGTIIVAGAGATTAALQRAAQAGVAGVVLGALPDEELRAYVGYDIGVAITGQERVPFTLILTEGFGRIAMAERTFKLLQSLQGQMASINGATQIRAGVIRPEIVVPHAVGTATGKDSAQAEQLAAGVRVRIIREPYFGQLADVVALPAELQTIATGAKVRVASVRLADGQETVVPRANLEIIVTAAAVQ
jgi:hypothetical protein